MTPHIVILGAGISGLATAWYLKRKYGSHISLTLIEKEHRVGGWIQTLRDDSFLFELGPRSIRSGKNSRATLELIEELKLQEYVLPPHQDAKKRFIFDGTQLKPLPVNIWEVPTNKMMKGLLHALWCDWRAPKKSEEDESIYSFFSRRLGRKWTEDLIDPFVSGIYAGNIHRLSLKSSFPRFDEWEQKYGSLLLGALMNQFNKKSFSPSPSAFVQKMSQIPLFSFLEGMETLPLALEKNLKEHLMLRSCAEQIKFTPDKVIIKLKEGNQITADHLISTLPLPHLSPLLIEHPLFGEKLKKLPYTSVFVVNVGFNQSLLPFKGFGYLVASRFNLKGIGCVWDSALFPAQNKGEQTRLTCMIGGANHRDIEKISDEEVIEHTLYMLRHQMTIKSDPQIIQIKKAYQAIPQFEIGYSSWKEEIQTTMQHLSPRLSILGSGITGVSINECIAEAQKFALSKNYTK